MPVENEPILDKARAARAQAEAARQAATVAVEAAVNRWPPPNNHRAFVQGLHMARPAANDYLMSEAARETFARLQAFKAAEEAEARAEQDLALAVAVEARAVKTELGDGRGALADAIVAARARGAEADTARATAERARGALVKARMACDQAEAALAAAR